MKRFLALLLALVLALSAGVTAMAAEEDVPQPLALYIKKVEPTMAIDNNRVATCVVQIELASEVSFRLTCVLQQKNGNRWDDIKQWQVLWTGSTRFLQRYLVSTGYDYQLKATIEILDDSGNVLESQTRYSTVYPY